MWEITFETWLIHCQDIIKFAWTQVKLSGHRVKIYQTLYIIDVNQQFSSTFACSLLELYPDIISVQIYTCTDE